MKLMFGIVLIILVFLLASFIAKLILDEIDDFIKR